MSEKKFTFNVARAPGSKRSYTKKESDLSTNEIQLLTANFVVEFNKLPEVSKMMFMHYLNQALSDRKKDALSKEFSGDNTLSEQGTTVPDEDQTTEGVHSNS
jgi:hypothetical protein